MITGTSGTSTYDFPVVMNNVIGAKFKLVKGYGGSAALRLAMERGEIEGFCGVGYNSMRTAGLADGKANILVQIGLAEESAHAERAVRHGLREVGARTARSSGWCSAGSTSSARSRAPPGVPEERVAALRDGFDRAMKDPALLADAEKAQVGIEPMSGAAIAAFVDEAYRTPAEVAAKGPRRCWAASAQ